MSKLSMLVAGVAGYVLGAKAGRTRYEQIRNASQKVTGNPKVREAAHKAQETVQTHAPGVADKVTSVASTAASKVRPGSGGDHAAETGWPADPATTTTSGTSPSSGRA
jgi:hypothetical protein